MNATPTETDWDLIATMFPGFERDEILVVARGFRRAEISPGPMTRKEMLLRFTRNFDLLRGTFVDTKALRKKIEDLSAVQIEKLADFFMAIVRSN